jgi:hypothetical protein
MRKIWTMLLGAQIILTPAQAAHAVQVAPAVQPVVAPHIAPEVQPTVAHVTPAVQPVIQPQIAPEVKPTVGPQVAPTVTVAPEANLPLSNSNFEAAGGTRPTIMPVVQIPLPGTIRTV